MTRRRVLLAAAVRGVIYRRLEEIRFRTGVAILVTVAAAGGIAVSVITATAGAGPHSSAAQRAPAARAGARAPVRVAPVHVRARVRRAPIRVPVRVAPVRVAPVDVAPVRVAPVDVAPVRVAPVDLATGNGGSGTACSRHLARDPRRSVACGSPLALSAAPTGAVPVAGGARIRMAAGGRQRARRRRRAAWLPGQGGYRQLGRPIAAGREEPHRIGVPAQGDAPDTAPPR